ncbi:MAG: hypothetical protein IT289_00245 [Oligoflexia bacterium]|nr:hypothetical protein [Oligoflexia bacterium]
MRPRAISHICGWLNSSKRSTDCGAEVNHASVTLGRGVDDGDGLGDGDGVGVIPPLGEGIGDMTIVGAVEGPGEILRLEG